METIFHSQTMQQDEMLVQHRLEADRRAVFLQQLASYHHLFMPTQQELRFNNSQLMETQK